jgi:lactoylglutathione lyase
MLKRIDAVVLFVEDLERAKAFYRDKVGLKLKSEDQGFAEFSLDNTTVALLDIPTAQSMVIKDSIAATRPSGARFQVAVYVDNVNAIYEEFKKRGVKFIKAPTDQPWGQRTANFEDPDGNLWEISQWLPGQGS